MFAPSATSELGFSSWSAHGATSMLARLAAGTSTIIEDAIWLSEGA